MDRKKRAYFIGILFIILAAVALYSTFSYKTCYAYACFQERMVKCQFTTFVSEEPDASWKYDVQGKSGSNCLVRVTLLQAKEGDLGLKSFEGHDMVCSYSLGVATYPEKDMSKCHGLLKEDLQSILITKLHEYVINNVGEIQDVFENTV